MGAAPIRVALGVLCGSSALFPGGAALASSAEQAAEGLGPVLSLYMGIPFAGILLSIALFPLLAPRFWHHHFGKVSAFWALALAVPFSSCTAARHSWRSSTSTLPTTCRSSSCSGPSTPWRGGF